MGSRCCRIFHNEKMMDNLVDSTSLLRQSEPKGVREQRKQTDRPKPSQNSQLSLYPTSSTTLIVGLQEILKKVKSLRKQTRNQVGILLSFTELSFRIGPQNISWVFHPSFPVDSRESKKDLILLWVFALGLSKKTFCAKFAACLKRQDSGRKKETLIHQETE